MWAVVPYMNNIPCAASAFKMEMYFNVRKYGRMHAMSRIIDELRNEDRKEFQLEIADRMIKAGYTEKEIL